jgi:hypothetical protein
LTNAIVLYEQVMRLLRKSTNGIQNQWLVLPTQLGYAWCLDQSGNRTAALENYRKALDLAWKREVTGDFNFKDWVAERWGDLRAGRNPIHKTRRGLGPGVCFSEEIIGYMLKLLDPVKDKREIAELKDAQAELKKMGRAITPIVIPLAANVTLAQAVDANAAVKFDLDGSGVPRQWGWITPEAAWLVYDHDGQGIITSGLQMFGNVTFWIFWPDGFAALSSMDADGDGQLCGDELRGLALWRDSNQNGISESGEVLPLSDYGILSISCKATNSAEGIKWNSAGVKFKDGSTRPAWDWIAPGK